MNDKNILTVALDMDSTVYDLHTPWLKWLKNIHNHDLKEEDIITWDWHEWLPCGTKVYDFLDLDDAFLDCYPYPGAVEAIKQVYDLGVRQFFVSTVKTKTGGWQKQQAILRDFPYLKDDVIITSHNKDIVRADLLVDDGPHNLEAFHRLGIVTCKVPFKYNEHVTSEYVMTNWNQYVDIINGVIASRRSNVQYNLQISFDDQPGGDTSSKLGKNTLRWPGWTILLDGIRK